MWRKEARAAERPMTLSLHLGAFSPRSLSRVRVPSNDGVRLIGILWIWREKCQIPWLRKVEERGEERIQTWMETAAFFMLVLCLIRPFFRQDDDVNVSSKAGTILL